jgi:CO/xanthine dehydrogenase FAD-binding subunit
MARTRYLAGGTNLLDLMKLYAVQPERLVNMVFWFAAMDVVCRVLSV